MENFSKEGRDFEKKKSQLTKLNQIARDSTVIFILSRVEARNFIIQRQKLKIF